MKKAFFNWSGGKDSSFTLYKILQNPVEYQIKCLLTTLNEKYKRISMHGVREELLDKQAEELCLDLEKIYLPENISMENYNALMQEKMDKIKAIEAEYAIFGDIFLEDLRTYREEQLKKVGLEAVFPLWNIPTDQLVHEFIDLGFKAIIVCVNEKFLDKSFAGRLIDKDFVKDLPSNVDPCGENGEFHSYVYDGPIFKKPIPVKTGEVVYRNYKKENGEENWDTGFWFCDLLLDE